MNGAGPSASDVPAVTVRLAQESDLKALIRVAEACFGASAWTEAQFTASLANLVLVADAPGQHCAGYAAAQSTGPGEGELLSLAVMPKFRRSGIGAALLEAALARLGELGTRNVFLEVRESNAAALGFYRHYGFELFGRRPDYYREPVEAAAVLMKVLGPRG